jgi:hypothetical protein
VQSDFFGPLTSVIVVVVGYSAAIYVQALAVGAAVFGALQNLGDTQDTAKVHSVGTGSVSQLGEVVGLEYS